MHQSYQNYSVYEWHQTFSFINWQAEVESDLLNSSQKDHVVLEVNV